MFSYIAKAIIAALTSGGVITELMTIDNGHTREIAIVLTALVNVLGVYAVPNTGRTVTQVTNTPPTVR